jgi:polysaccharide export outer membrane protein
VLSLNGCFTPEKEYLANLPRVTDEENAEVFTTYSTVPDDYVIIPGDSLGIYIYRRSDLSPLLTKNNFDVDLSGNIFIPLIGDIQAAGMTTRQLRSKISHDLNALYVSPVVNVDLIASAGQNIFVLGEVKKAGVYSVKVKTTALESIAMAGGFTVDADSSKVIILRTVQARNDSFKNTYFTALDLEKLLTKADIRQNIILRKGDIVFVPPDYISQSNRYYKNIATKLAPFINTVSAVVQSAVLIFTATQ